MHTPGTSVESGFEKIWSLSGWDIVSLDSGEMDAVKRRHARDELSTQAFAKTLPTTNLSTTMASTSNTPSSSYPLAPVIQDLNFLKMEGFKCFKALYNTCNTCCSYTNPVITYPLAKNIYQKVKNARGSELELEEFSFKDFVCYKARRVSFFTI